MSVWNRSMNSSVRGKSNDMPRRYGLFSRSITKTFRDVSKGSDEHISVKGYSSKSPVRFNYENEKKAYIKEMRES